MSAFLLFGANGFSGRLVAEEARDRGLRPTLAGRDARRLASLGARLGLEYRVSGLDDRVRLEALVSRHPVVLNAAGPFRTTALPLARACVEVGAHYLDLSGEIGATEAVAALDRPARARGVMLMPAVGFAVTPTDCLAAHVCRRLERVRRLRIALSRFEHVSRGSAATMIEQVSAGVRVRRGGALVTRPVGELESSFDFGAGKRRCVAVSWLDVFTAHHTTGVPDIEVYVEATALQRALYRWGAMWAGLLATPVAQSAMKLQANWLPEGPTSTERASGRRKAIALAEGESGDRAAAELDMPEPYTMTARCAVEIVEKVLRGGASPGYATPAGVFGPDLVTAIAGVRRRDRDL